MVGLTLYLGKRGMDILDHMIHEAFQGRRVTTKGHWCEEYHQVGLDYGLGYGTVIVVVEAGAGIFYPAEENTIAGVNILLPYSYLLCLIAAAGKFFCRNGWLFSQEYAGNNLKLEIFNKFFNFY